MELFLDTADLRTIEELWPLFPFAGVTTNPNIVARSKTPIREALPTIRAIVGPKAKIFAQVLARERNAMIDEALAFRELDHDLVVKIPALGWGPSAIRNLSERGIPTLGTAVFAPMQGFLAAQAGARYVAPYVASVDNTGGDGLVLVRNLQALLDLHCPSCSILAASFRTPVQVMDCLLAGAKAVTISPDTARQMLVSPAAEAAIGKFEEEWRKAFGTLAV
jgi:fructose-6-phosphate aldolase 1